MTSVFSPTVIAKQWIASVIYAIHMNKAQWFKYHLIGLSRPAETIKYMFEEIPQLATRFEIGPNELISDAVKASKDAFGQSEIAKPFNFINLFTTNIISLPVRSGDTAAIIFGGYPYYRSLIESGMSKSRSPKAIYGIDCKDTTGRRICKYICNAKRPKICIFCKVFKHSKSVCPASGRCNSAIQQGRNSRNSFEGYYCNAYYCTNYFIYRY